MQLHPNSLFIIASDFSLLGLHNAFMVCYPTASVLAGLALVAACFRSTCRVAPWVAGVSLFVSVVLGTFCLMILKDRFTIGGAGFLSLPVVLAIAAIWHARRTLAKAIENRKWCFECGEAAVAKLITAD